MHFNGIFLHALLQVSMLLSVVVPAFPQKHGPQSIDIGQNISLDKKLL